jgi:DNA modification methylase
LSRYVPDGGTVLDPTAGSFNSCFVADRLGYVALGIEKDETFYEKAVARLNPKKIEGGEGQTEGVAVQ